MRDGDNAIFSVPKKRWCLALIRFRIATDEQRKAAKLRSVVDAGPSGSDTSKPMDVIVVTTQEDTGRVDAIAIAKTEMTAH